MPGAGSKPIASVPVLRMTLSRETLSPGFRKGRQHRPASQRFLKILPGLHREPAHFIEHRPSPDSGGLRRTIVEHIKQQVRDLTRTAAPDLSLAVTYANDCLMSQCRKQHRDPSKGDHRELQLQSQEYGTEQEEAP